MSRRIEFRAWDTKNKNWVEAVPSLEYLLDDPDGCISHHDVDEEMGIFFYPANPLGADFGGRIIYQQWIGLKDQDNKKIYEGDIVETIDVEGGIARSKIVFHNLQFIGMVEDKHFVSIYGFDKEGRIKVIGNIFENDFTKYER